GFGNWRSTTMPSLLLRMPGAEWAPRETVYRVCAPPRAARRPPQIVNGQGAIEPALLAVPLGLLELQQFKNLRRFRKLALDHNALTSSTDARRRVGAARNSLSSVCPAP